MAVSLPPVSAKFIADVEGMLTDLKRAERATKSTGAVIDREVDQLTKNMKRKFSASDVGKDLLKGLGIGSGFALAEQAAQMIADHWRAAAEAAQSVAAATDRQVAATLKLIRMRQTDDQALAAMLKDEARLQKQLADAQAPKFETKLVQAGRDPEGGTKWKAVEVQREQTTEEIKLVSELSAQLQEKALEIAQAREKIAGNDTKEEKQRSSQIDRLNKQFAAFSKETEDGLREQLKLGNDQLQQLDEAAEKYRRMIDPMREFHIEIEAVRDLGQKSLLNPDETIAAIEAIRAKMVDKSLTGFFGPIDKQSTSMEGGAEGWDKLKKGASEFDREMAQMWNNVSDRAGEAFADIVLTGEASFSKLADIVARSVLEIVARMAIINPVLNMVFGGMSGWSALPSFFGGGKAAGGAVEPGYTYRVNENGQEFFKPNVGGTIMPVGASAQMRESKRSGNTYIIDARGTDESVVSRLAAALQALAGPGVVERRAIAAVHDNNARMAY